MIETIVEFYKLVEKNPSANYPKEINKSMIKRWIRNGIIDSVKHQDIYGKFYFNKRWLVSLDELIKIESERLEKLLYRGSKSDIKFAVANGITTAVISNNNILAKETLDEYCKFLTT